MEQEPLSRVCFIVCLKTVYLDFFVESVLKYTCILEKFEKKKNSRKSEILKHYT